MQPCHRICVTHTHGAQCQIITICRHAAKYKLLFWVVARAAVAVTPLREHIWLADTDTSLPGPVAGVTALTALTNLMRLVLDGVDFDIIVVAAKVCAVFGMGMGSRCTTCYACSCLALFRAFK